MKTYHAESTLYRASTIPGFGSSCNVCLCVCVCVCVCIVVYDVVVMMVTYGIHAIILDETHFFTLFLFFLEKRNFRKISSSLCVPAGKKSGNGGDGRRGK